MKRLALALLLASCAPPPPPEVGRGHGGLTTTNAIVSNAIVSNAIVSNAIVSNAIVSNAIVSNAIVSNAIVSNALTSTVLRPDGVTEGALARQFLAYLYSCAMPAGAEMPLDLGGTSYGTLHGGVGLAPEWGQPGGRCDGRCQRLVSGCLLARTNYWGVPVQISLRGPSPALVPDAEERATFALREGAYFGNLFVNDGVEHLYACSGPGSSLPQLTRRFCSAASGVCAIRVLFDCVNPGPTLPRGTGAPLSGARFACQRQDPDDGALTECSTGGVSIYGDDPRGKSFHDVVTVYLRAPVTVCGDGVCGGAESSASCALDCTTGWARAVPGLRNDPFLLGRYPDGGLGLGVVAGDSTDLGAGVVKILRGEEARVIARFGPDGATVAWSRPLVVTTAYSSFGVSRLDGAGNGYHLVGHYEPLWLERELLPVLPGGVPDMPATNLLVVKVSPDGGRVWYRHAQGEPMGLLLDGDRPVVLVNAAGERGLPEARALVLDPATGESTRTLPLPPEVGAYPSPLVVDGVGRLWMSRIDVGPPAVLAVDLTSGAATPIEMPSAAYGSLTPATRTADGGVIAVATLALPAGGYANELVRYDAGGALLWHRRINAPASADPLQLTASAVAVAPGGDLVVAGQFVTPMDLENDVFVPVGYRAGGPATPDVWVARYRADGVKRWARQLGGGGFESVSALTFDGADRVVVTGAFGQTGLFDGRILENPYGGGETNSFRTYVVAIPGR